jgi:hypothetical protein
MTTTTPPKETQQPKKEEDSNWKFYLLMGFLGFLALILIGTIIYFIVRNRGNSNDAAPTPAPLPMEPAVAPGTVVRSPVPVPLTPANAAAPEMNSPSVLPTAELAPFVPMYGPNAPANRPDSFNFTPTPTTKVGGRGRGRGKSSWKARSRK